MAMECILVCDSYFFVVVWMTSHFSGWKDICQSIPIFVSFWGHPGVWCSLKSCGL